VVLLAWTLSHHSSGGQSHLHDHAGRQMCQANGRDLDGPGDVEEIIPGLENHHLS